MRPEYRRQGCAQALLRELARIAVERGCGRFEWAVLDWNASAIEFYEQLGAAVLPDWRICSRRGPCARHARERGRTELPDPSRKLFMARRQRRPFVGTPRKRAATFGARIEPSDLRRLEPAGSGWGAL